MCLSALTGRSGVSLAETMDSAEPGSPSQEALDLLAENERVRAKHAFERGAEIVAQGSVLAVEVKKRDRHWLADVSSRCWPRLPLAPLEASLARRIMTTKGGTPV